MVLEKEGLILDKSRINSRNSRINAIKCRIYIRKSLYRKIINKRRNIVENRCLQLILDTYRNNIRFILILERLQIITDI